MRKNYTPWLWLSALVIAVALGIGFYRARNHGGAPDARPDRRATAQIKDNMLKLGDAADRYFQAHPDKSQISGRELMNDDHSIIISAVVGEGYDEVVIYRDWKILRLRLPSGRDLIVPRVTAKSATGSRLLMRWTS